LGGEHFGKGKFLRGSQFGAPRAHLVSGDPPFLHRCLGDIRAFFEEFSSLVPPLLQPGVPFKVRGGKSIFPLLRGISGGDPKINFFGG